MKTQRGFNRLAFTATCVAVVVLSGALTGCPAANTTTPAAPANPPQVQVLQYAQLASAAGDTTAHVLVVLCTPQAPATTPTLDLGTCNQIKTDLLKIQTGVNQIVVEANKVPGTETWAQARVNIVAIGANMVITTSVANPTLQADLVGLAALVQQIMGVQ
jgi:hypothetical protein